MSSGPIIRPPNRGLVVMPGAERPAFREVAGNYHGRDPLNSTQEAILNALVRVGAKPGIAPDELAKSIRKEDYIHYGVSRSIEDQAAFVNLLRQKGLLASDEKNGLQLTEEGRNTLSSGRVLI